MGWGVVLFATAGLVMLGALMAIFTFVGPARRWLVAFWGVDYVREQEEEGEGEQEPQPEPQPQPQGGQPLPVVEGDMPRFVTYYPRPGSAPRTCHCHGRLLLSGEDVLWWPVPEPPGAVYLICKTEDLP